MSDNDLTADFWCWTEGEPSTFRCRERGHDVRALSPGAPIGRQEESSISAQLRQTQRDLAASQEDLSRVERERDEMARQVESMRESYAWLDGVAANLRESGDLARAELASARQELSILRIQNAGVYQFASAFQEGNRGWQVARDGSHPCARCPNPIVRGQGVEPTPDAHGWFQHVHCPDVTASTDTQELTP